MYLSYITFVVGSKSKVQRFSLTPSLSWGLVLQFLFGLLILRWSYGKTFFKCIGDKVRSTADILNSIIDSSPSLGGHIPGIH